MTEEEAVRRHRISSRGLAEIDPVDSNRQDKGERHDESRQAILAA